MIKSVSRLTTSKRKRSKMNYYDESESSINSSSSPEEDSFLYYNLRNQANKRKFFSHDSQKLGIALKSAVYTVIPHIRRCIEEEYRWEPFTEFPKWYSDYQDALDESWELIFKGGNQRKEPFQFDGGHVTIFLLAAEIDSETFGAFKKFCSKRNPKRLAQVKDLDHRIKSLPCASGTKPKRRPVVINASSPEISSESDD